MVVFGSNSKWQRPKFQLKLAIHELINIPQSSGYCFARWHLKDGTGISASSPQSQNHASKGLTPRATVKDHRALWDYSGDEILVKLHVEKETKQLAEKILVIEVFFEFVEDIKPRNSTSSTPSTRSYKQKVLPKVLLGSVSINIAEYVNEVNETVSNRFLLKKSRINAILSVSVGMQLVRGEYTDFAVANEFSSGQLPDTFRGGPGNGSIGPEEDDFTSPSLNKRTVTSSKLHSTAHAVNPAVERLYQKTFQVNWDMRPGEFTPKECIEDIFQGGNGWAKNEKGVNLIDLQALSLQHGDEDIADIYNYDKKAYLEQKINTAQPPVVQRNLKSWKITRVLD